jgi:hypothetical protein
MASRFNLWLLAILLIFPCEFSVLADDRYQLKQDWLINSQSFIAQVEHREVDRELVLTNGLIQRAIRLAPNAATIRFDNLMTGESLLRGLKPEALVTIDGVQWEVGGLVGQKNYAFLPEPNAELSTNPNAFQFSRWTVGEIEPRLEWKQVRRVPQGVVWPPRGKHVVLHFDSPVAMSPANVSVEVHYEIYDGLPLLSKWIRVKNDSDQSICINRFASELLACVEAESMVENRPANRTRNAVPDLFPNIQVETDYAMGAMDSKTANGYSVHWEEDPQYDTQVSYLRASRCLLRVGLNVGPEQTVEARSHFESFRAYVMPLDSTDRERCGLAQRKLYRTIAPWIQENPLMLHARFSDPDRLRQAIDQASDVGFEVVIQTFGSGFNIENDSTEYLDALRTLSDYAKSKGVELGGYSLLSSRTIGNGMDNHAPDDLPEAHGNSPNLVSPWGQAYFAKVKNFFSTTGLGLLEHDGPYPGDFDQTARPPYQKGFDDSQYIQWKTTTDFYSWLRSEGVYLNQPDWYFLKGANKTAMGYREVNWSLPRREQQIHTRQNIYDGTWTKTPSMGWMFVPLTEYHGGGPAATIEPLNENLSHYETMLASNLLLGVQACYRGPRLYDSQETRAMVKKWVDLYKRHRDILESDLLHLRRADGHRLDFMMHVNPQLDTSGFLAVFNPTNSDREERILVPLYYTGLTGTVQVREKDGEARVFQLDARQRLELELKVPANGITWLTFEKAD